RAPARSVLMRHRPPSFPLLPYTTLFRSRGIVEPFLVQRADAQEMGDRHLGIVGLLDGACVRLDQLVVAASLAVQPLERLERVGRSEEHTSELQSRENLVCRLLPEKKKSA